MDKESLDASNTCQRTDALALTHHRGETSVAACAARGKRPRRCLVETSDERWGLRDRHTALALPFGRGFGVSGSIHNTPRSLQRLPD